jgi:ADP-ribose pyrophosphatase
MMELYSVVKSEDKYSGIVIDVVHETITLPNGKEAKMEIIIHGGAAAVVPIDEDGKLILVRQYRHAAKQMTLELPAGCLEKNEDPMQCAIRELEEETGYIGTNPKLLTKIYTSIGFCTEVIYIYKADCKSCGVVNLDEDEFVTVEKYSMDEACGLITTGEIIDSKTITGILMLKSGL